MLIGASNNYQFPYEMLALNLKARRQHYEPRAEHIRSWNAKA